MDGTQKMLSLISRPNNNLIKGPKTQLPMAAKPKDHTQSSPATPLRHRHRQCVWGAPKKAFPIYTLLLICVDAFRTAWGAIPRLPPPPPPTTHRRIPRGCPCPSRSIFLSRSDCVRLCVLLLWCMQEETLGRSLRGRRHHWHAPPTPLPRSP